MQSGRRYFTACIGGLGLLLILGGFFFERCSSFTLDEIAVIAGKSFETKIEQCQAGLNLLQKDSLQRNALSVSAQQLGDYYEQERIAVYLWLGDSLLLWNNSQIPMEIPPSGFTENEGLIKLSHGYCLYTKRVFGNWSAVALSLVKPIYELENNYLKNDFRQWTGIPRGIKLEESPVAGKQVMLGTKYLFSLKGNETLYYKNGRDSLGFVFFLSGFAALLMLLLIRIRQSTSVVWGITGICVLIIARIGMIGCKWPSFFYRTGLYDLQLFGNAQSFANGYLGDILLNGLSFLFVASTLYFLYGRAVGRTGSLLYRGSVFIFILWIAHQFNDTSKSLINNSTLSFDFLSIFNIRFEAFIGLFALGIYALSLFILVYLSLRFFNNTQKSLLIFFSLYLLLCFCLQLFSPGSSFIRAYWLCLYALALFILSKYYRLKIALALGLQIIVMSVLTSHFFNASIEKNQQQDLDILSMKLGEKQDPILESEFEGIPDKMRNDGPLEMMFSFWSEIPTAEKEAAMLLKQKYFGGYFDRYTIQFSLFDKDCHPLLDVKNPVLLNEGFFEEQIRYNSDSTFVEGLFFVKNYKKNSQYIGKIQLKDKRLYVLLEPKQFEELGSFPDLLLDASQQKPEKLKGFSHAVYRSQLLTSRYGDYNYPFSLQDSARLAQSNTEFIHHYYQPDENTEVVISEKAKNWKYFFTFNSYLLLFFSLLSYLVYLLYSLVFTDNFKSPTLTRRIQTIIVVLLLLAMSAVGITSGNLVTGQFERNNKKQLEEKTQIIMNELTGQFVSDQFFDISQKELVNLKLREYSRLFNTPISLFHKSGVLFNTSEPKLYDMGLAASLVNPKAFWKLKDNQSSSESVTDRAGSLKYLSLYTPLFDSKKELIGFINLPYFARQSDLVNELSGIISALINVYVILFVISILAGLILSGFITQPLRLIKQQLSHVTLGKQNEKIVWQSNDEIGKLVSEYNNMLVKLENSAHLLAQSERESAWREMAKQVAHEIKNPLTPMKLNLQYLQHLMKNNPEDFKEKFEKTSAGIIEQIDSLANIAGAFSNFARLPGTQLETINLTELVMYSVLIFENQKNILIENLVKGEELWVHGDKDQCLRVFNNLLKNAVQALDEIPNPFIRISSSQTSESVVIAIEDNGCGIDTALKSNIFTPNFTTKTTGSGLGLAMVKNSMLGFGGDVTFVSEQGKGTVFYLEFKRSAHPDKNKTG